MTPWVLDWLRAFGITVAVEAAISVPLLTRVEPRLARRLAALMLLNLATHPLVWFLFPASRLRTPCGSHCPKSGRCWPSRQGTW